MKDEDKISLDDLKPTAQLAQCYGMLTFLFFIVLIVLPVAAVYLFLCKTFKWKVWQGFKKDKP